MQDGSNLNPEVLVPVVSRGPVHTLEHSLFTEACDGISAEALPVPALTLQEARSLPLPPIKVLPFSIVIYALSAEIVCDEAFPLGINI